MNSPNDTESDPIQDIKDDVATYRNRVQQGLQNVRDAVDPRDVIEDSIRKQPLAAVGIAALAGVVAGSAFLPAGRRSPIGMVMGGMLTMAYRGFFMAATPVFAQKVADVVAPRRSPASKPPHPDFPDDLSRTQTPPVIHE